MGFNKSQLLILAIALAGLLTLVYSSHFSNQFPIHIDEWRHITESIKLKEGNIPTGIGASEIGFHLFFSEKTQLWLDWSKDFHL